MEEEVDEFANIISNNLKVEIGNIRDAIDVMKMINRIYKNDKRLIVK